MKLAATLIIAGAALSGCTALNSVDQLTREAVQTGCSASELSRAATRNRLADWGLWVKCVEDGTLYDTLELVEKQPT